MKNKLIAMGLGLTFGLVVVACYALPAASHWLVTHLRVPAVENTLNQVDAIVNVAPHCVTCLQEQESAASCARTCGAEALKFFSATQLPVCLVSLGVIGYHPCVGGVILSYVE